MIKINKTDSQFILMLSILLFNEKKLTSEERLEKKRDTERLRYQKIKDDRDKFVLQKQKEKYIFKKEGERNYKNCRSNYSQKAT